MALIAVHNILASFFQVIIHDAVDISGVSEGHMVYCEFQVCVYVCVCVLMMILFLCCGRQLVGASQQPLGTDEVVLSEDGCARLSSHNNKRYKTVLLDYRFDTEGTFETASPVPALKLQLKLASKGIFKNDKILGKVHTSTKCD